MTFDIKGYLDNNLVRPFSIVLMAFFSCVVTYGQESRETYGFLNVPTSSRVYGLGGTNVALVSDDVSLSEQNPALLGRECDRQLLLSYMHYLGGSNFGGARFGMGAGLHGAWAAGIRYLNYGELAGYDENGYETGKFSAHDVIMEGTYSHDFNDRLRGGISVKGIYSGYESYTAFALAADLGLNYYNPEKDTSLSLVLKNMGGQLKRFEDNYDHLPFDIQLGWMQGLGRVITLNVTAYNLIKWKFPSYSHQEGDESEGKVKENFSGNFFRHLIFGIQYEPIEQFYIDAAYNYKVRSDMNGYSRNFLSGLSLGCGFKAKGFSVGVAYAMPQRNTSTFMLNLGINIASIR